MCKCDARQPAAPTTLPNEAELKQQVQHLNALYAYALGAGARDPWQQAQRAQQLSPVSGVTSPSTTSKRHTDPYRRQSDGAVSLSAWPVAPDAAIDEAVGTAAPQPRSALVDRLAKRRTTLDTQAIITPSARSRSGRHIVAGGSITQGTSASHRRASSPLRQALSPSQLAQLHALHTQALQHSQDADADTARSTVNAFGQMLLRAQSPQQLQMIAEAPPMDDEVLFTLYLLPRPDACTVQLLHADAAG